MKKILFIMFISSLFSCIAMSGAIAEQHPKIKVALATEKTNFLLDTEPIKFVITLENMGGDIITSKGFKGKPFHLYLTFTNPDKKGIRAKRLENMITDEPPPPPVISVDGKVEQAEPVETIEDGWLLTVTIPDAHEYYSLTEPGDYEAKLIIPMVTYPSIVKTVNGVNYALIDSADWSGALESNTVKFSLEEP